MVDIFISYARADQATVRRLAAALEAQGWSVFWDLTIPAGESWRSYIGKALEDARCVVVAWSEASIKSHYVLEEAEAARKRNVLVPVLLAEIDPPFGFGSITAAKLVGWAGDADNELFVPFRAAIARKLGDSPALIKERERQHAEAERKAAEFEERRRAEAERKAAELKEKQHAEAQLRARAQEAEQRREAEHSAERRKRQAAGANVEMRGPSTQTPEAVKPNPRPKRIAIALAVVVSIIAVIAWINIPQAKYLLTVTTTPPNASIKIENVGQYDPGMRLEAGTYRIRASLAGHQAVERTFTVAERDVTLDIRFQPVPPPKLVRIPAGTFMMGSADGDSDELPVRAVHIDQPFYLGSTEVTFDQYDAFAEATGRELPSDWGWGRGDRPIINVSWQDAKAYAQWLSEETGNSCRLPSEAEWEYAARAGTETRYALPAPEGGDNLSGSANCRDCGSSEHVTSKLNELIGKQTLPVASFPANAWGLHDMHGNVWEWVEDCYQGSYEGAPVDGSAWLEENGGQCSLRVLRGGSWVSSQDVARSAIRLRNLPFARYRLIGFRVLCSSPILNSDH